MQNTDMVRTIRHPTVEEETWIRYGDENMFRGEFETAVTNYEHAIRVQPDSARAWSSKANALEALGKLEEALRAYDTALEFDHGNAECWFNKGVTLKKIGRTKDGAACIDHGVNIAMGSG